MLLPATVRVWRQVRQCWLALHLVELAVVCSWALAMDAMLVALQAQLVESAQAESGAVCT
jgi:hypothetical protein